MATFEFEPIGFVRSSVRYTQEAPRQGVLTAQSGVIQLEKQRNFEAAFADLAGVEMIWIIFVFDRVRNWKSKVRPPLGGMERKIGVFATRSPHRPNPIGITAAKLTAVRGLSLHVEGIDLLDGPPVLDIKPYIPMADSFPEAKTGWREEISSVSQQLIFTPESPFCTGLDDCFCTGLTMKNRSPVPIFSKNRRVLP